MNPTDGDPGSGSFGGLFESAGAFGILVLVMMAIIVVVFVLANGERREFRVRDRDFGLMVEGDQGTVTFRGDILQRFDRVPSAPTTGGQVLQQDAAPIPAPEVRPSPERPADGRRPGDAWGN